MADKVVHPGSTYDVVDALLANRNTQNLLLRRSA
jgi:hypothetical protein